MKYWPFLPVILLITLSQAHGAPSFDCRRALTIDELTICDDPKLSELDRLRSKAFKRQLAKDRKQAIEEAQSFLKSRRFCANDRYCLLETMEFMPGGEEKPAWLTDAYKAQLAKEVAQDDLRKKSLMQVGQTGGFPKGEKSVQATLSSLDGVDTSYARARGKVTRADASEYCERDPGGATIKYGGKLTFKGCIDAQGRELAIKPPLASANCLNKVLTADDGDWKAVG